MNLGSLYIQRTTGGPWQEIPEEDDPNETNAAIHDLWEQGIAEVSIDGEDYIISDQPEGVVIRA